MTTHNFCTQKGQVRQGNSKLLGTDQDQTMYVHSNIKAAAYSKGIHAIVT